MKRILILGQPGRFGGALCDWAASRLAQRLKVPRISAGDLSHHLSASAGWIAATRVGACPDKLLRAADTAIWLHFSPLSVLRAWMHGLRLRITGSPAPHHVPGLADLRDSLLHMAWTPHVHRMLCHPAMSHLQVVHLRSPAQADFWLRMQEQRLMAPSGLAQAA